MDQDGRLEPRYDRAVALHRGGSLQEAAALYRDVLVDEPGHAGALHLLGVIEGQSGRYPEAAALIERAIGIEPNVAAAHANLGNTQLALGSFDQALASYERALSLQPGHRQALIGRARAYRSLDRITEALSAYEAALGVEPECSESLMGRGDILLTLGRTAEGVASLRRAAECGADVEGIRFALASIGVEATPGAAPVEYVRVLFDDYADRFDRALIEGLSYQIPQLLTQLVLREPPPAPLDILDLGCGTGLCGRLLRPIARRLTGVDVSSGMLAKSHERGVYSELECVELTEYLSQRDAEFDLVLAGDVFVYIGDLGPVFAGVRRALRSGGRFAFSVEAGETQEYELARTRRYRHSKSYLARLAAESGFIVETIERCVLRLDAAGNVDGLLASLRLCR